MEGIGKLTDQIIRDIEEKIEGNKFPDILEKKFSEILEEKGQSSIDSKDIQLDRAEEEVGEMWRPIRELNFQTQQTETGAEETKKTLEEHRQEEIQEEVEDQEAFDNKVPEEIEASDKPTEADVEEGQGKEETDEEGQETILHGTPETETSQGDSKNKHTEEEQREEKEISKEEIKKKNRERDKKIIKSFLIKLVVTVAALWLIFTFVFGVIRVDGEAMYPRLRDGDIGLYYRIEKDYNIGDVVVFENNGFTCTARVVAKAGDVVEVSDAGALMVNRNVQFEEIFYPTERIPGGIQYPYTVGENSYFLLCDFRTQSSDSRYMGAIEKTDIKGKVVTILRRRGI